MCITAATVQKINCQKKQSELFIRTLLIVRKDLLIKKAVTSNKVVDIDLFTIWKEVQFAGNSQGNSLPLIPAWN